MGTQVPLLNRGKASQFSAPICCGQMARWIKMPLGRKVGLGSGHIVLDGDPAPLPKKRAQPPNFRPMSIVPKRLADQDATCCGGRPQSKRHCVRWGQSTPPPKGGRAPSFWLMSSVAKRLHGSRCHCPGHIVLDVDPAPSPRKKGHSPPIFWPVFVVAKWLDGSRCLLVR